MGTLVLTIADPESSYQSELRFWFQAPLSGNGKTVQHVLIMNGDLDGDWMPTGTTLFTLTDWHIGAETRGNQRNDCAGSGVLGAEQAVIIGVGPAE